MLKGQMNKLRRLAIAGLALVVVLVVLQNRQVVETELPFLTPIVPDAGIFFGTLLIGFGIGVFIAKRRARKGTCPTKKTSEELAVVKMRLPTLIGKEHK